MKRDEAFTLVELLVVIAIIAILAGIVIPNVPKFIAKARMARAYSEVKGIDLALTKMLTDANRQDFRSGFFSEFQGQPLAQALETYQQVFYILLRKGKDAESDPDWQALTIPVRINPDVKRRLGSSYMDLGKDPWGQLYSFWPGPWRPADGPIPFRIYRIEEANPVPGGPKPDADSILTSDPEDKTASPEQFYVGIPAARDLTTYVWSAGRNLAINQDSYAGYLGPADEVGLDYMGGGDDINNWDNDQSWAGFYN